MTPDQLRRTHRYYWSVRNNSTTARMWCRHYQRRLREELNTVTLSCPFCGGAAHIEKDINVTRLIITHKNDCTVLEYKEWQNWHFQDESMRKDLPIAAWNRRDKNN